jgi:hypothetical protein
MKWFAGLLGFVLAAGAPAWGQELLVPSLYHIPKVAVAPQPASPLDEISVTVAYWAPTGGYHIDHSAMQVQGNIIRLNLDWHVDPDVFVIQAFCWASGTVSIGKWPRGTYTVFVTNNGQDGGSATFVVGVSVSISPSTPTAWSFIDRFFNRSNDSASGGESLIDRLRNAFGR